MPAVAKVKSITIESIGGVGNTPYLTRDLASIITKPLVMESLKGNPIVTYRIYTAEGRESDHSKFTLLGTDQRVFAHYEIHAGVLIGWRLDTSKGMVGFGSLLRPIPPGTRSFYVTADDGEGECPPSNIVTAEMMPYADQVLEKPVISDVRSPAAGIVVFRLHPLVYRGLGDPMRYIRVYKSDGTQLDYEKFTPVGNRFGPYSMEDTSSVSDQHVKEVVVIGLKSGETSILAHVQLEWGSWVKGIRSNILTVDVTGTSPNDAGMTMYMNPIVTSGVYADLPSGDDTQLYPNPADRVIHLRAKQDGEMKVRIFTMLGEQVASETIDVAGGVGMLDIAGLAEGGYLALIESRSGTHRASFVVMR